MSLGIYMDVNVRWAISGVLTAQADGARQLSDAQLLDRAMQLDRVLFTHDQDFLREAVYRQRSGIPIASLAFAHHQGPSDRRCIDDLELIATLDDPVDWAKRVAYLPF